MNSIYILQLAFPPAFLFATLVSWLLFAKYRIKIEQLLLLALAVLAGQWIGGLTLMQLRGWNLPAFDEYVYRLDGLAGFQPSFALGRILMPHPQVMLALDAIYASVLLAPAIVIALHLWRGSTIARRVFCAFVLDFALAPFIYVLVPVCGPGYAFKGSYPFTALTISPHATYIHAPPNGIPSIHLATAILVLWFSRRMPFGRWVAAAYLAGTILATLGSGEHYLVDLVLAVPYAAGCVWLGSTQLMQTNC